MIRIVLQKTYKKKLLSATLIGVRHIGTPEEYRLIRREIDEALFGRKLIFAEGIWDNPTLPLRSKNAIRINALFNDTVVSESHKYQAQNESLVTQEANLQLPASTKLADVSRQLEANFLDAQGIRVPWWLYEWTLFIQKDPQRSKILCAIMHSRLMQRYGASFVEKLSVYAGKRFHILWRKTLAISLAFRDDMAVQMIRAMGGDKKSFILIYGESHLPGLTKFLEAEGWKKQT